MGSELKKSLLSKTQEANEMFKETLKRFGLLSVTGLLVKLVDNWDKNIASVFCYLVPFTYASWTIWEIKGLIYNFIPKSFKLNKRLKLKYEIKFQ